MLNGIKSGGFSLRRSLIEDQGVTLESDVRAHLAKAYALVCARPAVSVASYRVPAAI